MLAHFFQFSIHVHPSQQTTGARLMPENNKGLNNKTGSERANSVTKPFKCIDNDYLMFFNAWENRLFSLSYSAVE